MNRSLFGGCLIVLFGCGARTESFTDFDGAGGQVPGAGGASAVAGAPHAGGAANIAGAFQVGGSGPSTGGRPGIGGSSPNIGGRSGVGGSSPNNGGGPGRGGALNVAGASNTAGSGATAGIVEACQVIAGNSCQLCLCNTCSAPLVECFSNLGCALILACAEQTGCQGLACYSAQNCRPVIDRFGGLRGDSMADVLSLLSCSAGSLDSCNCN